MEATHKISAVYYPKKKEVELTWEEFETHKTAYLTTTADEDKGREILQAVIN